MLQEVALHHHCLRFQPEKVSRCCWCVKTTPSLQRPAIHHTTCRERRRGKSQIVQSQVCMRNRTPENVAGTEEKNEARLEKQSSDKLWVLEDCVTFIFHFQALLKIFK